MPRPTCRRNIGFLPSILRFKPAGIRAQDLDEVLLGHDELEALRLKDLIGLSQEEAAKQVAAMAGGETTSRAGSRTQIRRPSKMTPEDEAMDFKDPSMSTG